MRNSMGDEDVVRRSAQECRSRPAPIAGHSLSAMDGCSYGVPVIALPSPLEPPAQPRLSASGHRAATQTIAAFDRLHSAAGSFTDWRRDIDPLLADAASHAGFLADTLAATAPPIPAEAAVDPSPICSYFGVRSATLSVAQVAAQEAAVIGRALADLQSAPVEINAVIAEVVAARAVLCDFVRHRARNVRAAPRTATDSSASPARCSSTGTGLERWVVGHHVYFMFNIRAAATVQLALKALNQGRDTEAAEHLTVAACYVHGFTAAMGHAGAILGVRYREQIRPTMGPPDTPVPLTGRMHKEHRAFRTAITQLLGVLPEPYPVLATREPNLARAREMLLEADLLDIERHTLIAAALVGEERSLVQRRDHDNAVNTLRQMRLLRSAQYCPLLRVGDQLAAKSVAVAREQIPTELFAAKSAPKVALIER